MRRFPAILLAFSLFLCGNPTKNPETRGIIVKNWHCESGFAIYSCEKTAPEKLVLRCLSKKEWLSITEDDRPSED